MAGLIGIGRQNLYDASGGFRAAAGLEQQRNAFNEQMEAARKAQTMSMATTGAGIGGSVGINNYLAAKDALAAQQLAAQGAVSTAAAAPATAAQIGAGTEAATIMANAYNPAFQAAAIEAAGATAAGTTAGTTAGVTAVGTTAGAAAPAAVAAPAAAAPAAGPLAAVGTIATPLLIGAGAALLLDQVFDIF